MNISYNWLKNYINIDIRPDELSTALTSIGLEVGCIEEVQTIKGGLEGLVVAEILTCLDHENSDHLHVTTVNYGASEPIQVVCGAPNVAAGQKVILATIGTVLYSGDDSFTIKRSKIRGIESCGMLCGETEIGVGTNNDGIVVLPNDVKVGTPASEYYGVKSDYLLEVDITPNRIDAASHYGVARDVAAYFALKNPTVKLTKPSVENFKTQSNSLVIPVEIENTEACLRYTGVTIKNVKVGDSPKWIKDALQIIGLRPINNIVDVTNYVLHELGQPLHAFDVNKIEGGKIVIKNFPEGTLFKTLDGVERKLSADDLMIGNVETPMCIAGVFGGLDSGVTDETTSIFIESAYFNPVSVRKTARRHGLNTDSSFRFERGVDPNNTLYALKRAALLIREVAGGEISSEIVDIYPSPIAPFEVRLNLDKVNSLIGKEIGRNNIEKIITALEIEIVKSDNDGWYLKVPAYRVDVQRDVDVIEDILRIYGYNNVEVNTNLRSTLNIVSKPDTNKLQNLISEQLTALGFNEVLNNSLTRSSYYESLKSYPTENCVKLMNPLSSDLSVMRQTMVFGGLENIAYNANRRNQDLKLYEFGNCYYFNTKNKNADDALAPYSEDYHLAIWMTGNKASQSWAQPTEKVTVYDLKAHIENIFNRLGLDTKKMVMNEYADDIFAEALKVETQSGKTLVAFGKLHSNLKKKLNLDNDVFYADINWSNLIQAVSKHKVATADISKYPEVRRDLALLIDRQITFGEIEKIAFETERKLLKNVNLFDVYEGKNLEEGKKSYAVSFILQDVTKTLTDNQIDSIMKRLQQNFETKIGAKLR
jgi:phenylalanyl-tRNA synthetase beta chain